MENRIKHLFHRLAWISLILIYLVILAGSVVRMTGSGMGCPDWPMCFGLIIPPTDVSQITFDESISYQTGQMLLHDKVLYSAKETIPAGASWQAQDWEAYTKHDYTIFNVYHTWTEYVNRLIGALSGIPILLLFFTGLVGVFRKRLLFSYLALATVTLVLLGFQAWLGSIVVETVLAPVMITFHMLVALLIVALLIYIILYSRNGVMKLTVPSSLKVVLFIAVALSLIQILLGTQVRQQIDHIAHHMDLPRGEWIANVNSIFEIHRSFAILVVLTNAWLFYKNWSGNLGISALTAIGMIVVLEVLTGMVLAYLDMPPIAQSIHLFFASILFGLQIYSWLNISTFSNRER